MTTYEKQYQHETLRKKLWIEAWSSTANAVTCTTHDTATKWADSALEAFDQRFPKPVAPVFEQKEQPVINTEIHSTY